MPIRFTHQIDTATIVWEMLPSEEARYRREWDNRAESGQTHGSYKFRALLVNEQPYEGNYSSEDFGVKFGASPEEPFEDD